MSGRQWEDGNREATRLAGAAVAHFLRDDRESTLECLRAVPDPPGAAIGLLRFAALAVAAAAAAEGTDPTEAARSIVMQVYALEGDS